MLPTKWKIFRITNYLHITCVGAMVLMNAYEVYPNMPQGSVKVYLAILLIVVWWGSLISNGFVNIYLAERCYPDKQPGKRARITITVLSVLASILVLLLSANSIHLLYIYIDEWDVIVPRSKISLAIHFMAGFTGIYICWQQFILRKVIAKNYNNQLNNFLRDP